MNSIWCIWCMEFSENLGEGGGWMFSESSEGGGGDFLLGFFEISPGRTGQLRMEGPLLNL